MLMSRREVPCGTDVCGQFAGRERHRAAVVDVHPVRCGRGEFVSVERGVGPRDDRPRVRVGGRFAGEVPGVEFREGGVDVVEVEHDARHDPFVGVDLDDAEHLGWNASAAGRGPRADTTEGEALPAGRNDGRRHVRDPDVGDRPHVRDLGISTVSDPGVHDPTTIVVEMSSASISAMASQSRAAKYAMKRSYTRLAAFSSRGAGG